LEIIEEDGSESDRDSNEYEVEHVINVKVNSAGAVLALVKWLGWDESWNSWVPEVCRIYLPSCVCLRV
jgi:hypothetical protein